MPRLRPTVGRYFFLLVVLAANAPVEAQGPRFDLSGDVTLDEVDAVVRGHLQRAEALTANARWDEVIETLRQVTDNRGDRVIDVQPHYYVRLRDFCHRRLAALPPEALAIYRDQVDGQAEEWFNQAVAQRDEQRLKMIVDQFYCSSRGDDALRLLGDAALQRGDYCAARGYWEQLLELPPAVVAVDHLEALLAEAALAADDRTLVERYYLRRDSRGAYVLHAPQRMDPALPKLAELMRSRGIVGPRLAYPRGELSAADVYARLILVNVLEGAQALAAAGIREMQAVYPEARGRLGGREVNYVEALAALLNESRSWPAKADGREWPTFAGNAARNRAQPFDFDAGRVRWRKPLGPVSAGDRQYPGPPPGENSEELLSYHPIVVGGNVFVCDGNTIRGFNLATGSPAFGTDPIIYPTEHQAATPDFDHQFNQRTPLGVPRYTLTAHNDRLYARLGRPITSSVVDGMARSLSSRIVCLDLTKEGSVVWTVDPPADDRWAFEGSPIVDDDFIYVGVRKGGVRPQAHVFCYDVESRTLQWRRSICSAESPGQGSSDEITHNLLTLVGDTLFYSTNLGAVAALSKHDGEVRWIVTYPRAQSGESYDGSGRHFYRDLTPCVYDRGTLLVAPSDTPQVFALDAACGVLLWETSRAESVLHLLGTKHDHLLAAGEHQWWIHAVTGKIENVWPDQSPHGRGRGAIVGNVVLRPTAETIDVLGVDDWQPRPAVDLTLRDAARGGNLVAVDGTLLIASGTELIALDRYAGSSAARAKAAAGRNPPNPRVDE